MHPLPVPASAVTLDAGPFGEWLAGARASLRGSAGTEVPCGDCVGCCVSSYYIPIRDEDRAALKHIPEQHLVHSRTGQLHMGYLPDGRCPMLGAGGCTIYQDRPQTCRDYDCRFFAAAGIEAGGPGKRVINDRVRQWRFSYPAAADREAHDAVLAAAAFIRREAGAFPRGFVPQTPTGVAVLAIKTYDVFLAMTRSEPDAPAIAGAVVAASRRFDTGVE